MERSGANQSDFAYMIGVDQTAVSRWLRGVKPPTEAARVAWMAVRLERNPLEAFVAAGMITVEQAQTAIDQDSVALLDSLDRSEPRPSYINPRFERSGPDASEVSAPDESLPAAASTETTIEPGDLEDQ